MVPGAPLAVGCGAGTRWGPPAAGRPVRRGGWVGDRDGAGLVGPCCGCSPCSSAGIKSPDRWLKISFQPDQRPRAAARGHPGTGQRPPPSVPATEGHEEDGVCPLADSLCPVSPSLRPRRQQGGGTGTELPRARAQELAHPEHTRSCSPRAPTAPHSPQHRAGSQQGRPAQAPPPPAGTQRPAQRGRLLAPPRHQQ